MFENVFNFVDDIVFKNVGTLVPTFMDTISPLIGSCVVLYALWLAWQSLYDAENMMIMESMKFIGSLALCTTIAFSASWYIDSIVPIIYYSGDDIASKMLNYPSISNALDEITISFVERIEFIYNSVEVEIFEGETWKALLLSILLIIILLIGFIPFLVVSSLYLIAAKVMVGFLLIIGPLYIMFAFFPSTRNMFQSWTGLCLNYTLLILTYSIGFSIFTLLIDAATPENLSMKNCIFTLILLAVCTSISTQIPAFCSSLTGGVGINGLVGSMGAGARTMGAAGKAAGKYSGANAAGRWAGNKVKTGAKNLLDKTKNNIKPG
jgi:type IV secretion system protein VirB6